MLLKTALSALLLLAACSSSKKKDEVEPVKEAPSEPSVVAPISGDIPEGEIIRTSRETEFTEMAKELAEADVIYVGATRGNADHHLIQLRVIEHLFAYGRLHAIGIEDFPRATQKSLDDYVLHHRGDALDGQGPYADIFAFARLQRLPVIALGVERELLDAVVESGDLEGLTLEQRMTLPALHLDSEARRTAIEAAWEGEESGFERFFRATSVSEAVMADTIERWYRSAPERAQIAVLAGKTHIARRLLPDLVQNRIGRERATVLPVAAPKAAEFAKSYADFVWVEKAGE
ncbi:MAG: ChaN family lipoprotein [Planctomycetota bacterium]|jgi:uncharacterized iron-regulated protein